MKKGRWIIVGVAATAAILALGFIGHRKDDQTLAAELVGKWQAQDTSNAALHKDKEPIKAEEIEVKADGNLIYATALAADPTKIKVDHWGWRVQKGRLGIQFRGEDATDDWMPSMRFNISGDTLTLYRKNFAPKEFTRVIK